jgi:N-carbamoylputrescine amidase
VSLTILLFTEITSQVHAKAKEVKVAICQIFALDGDRKGNLARIEHALIESMNGGADIACFPEASILGWVNPDAHNRAFPIPGQDSEHLCNLAKKYHLYISIGLCEKESQNLYDSVILIDSDGKILLKHRKINILKKLMTPPYTPGTMVNAIDTEFGKIGLLICADTFKNNILSKMADLKPDLLLVPYGWAAKEDEWPEHGNELSKVVKKTAIKVGASVVGTDLVGLISKGPWQGRTYGGQSVAADRKGNIIYIGNDRDRDVHIITMSLQR